MFEKFQTPFVSIELRPNTALQLTRSASLRAQLNATVRPPTDGKVLLRRVARVCKRCKSMDQKRANELVGRGNSFHRAKKYEQAIAAYEEAIKLFPAYGSFKLVIGDMLLELRRYEEAAQAYRETLEFVPDHDQARVSLEQCMRMLGSCKEIILPPAPAGSSDPASNRLNLAGFDVFGPGSDDPDRAKWEV